MYGYEEREETQASVAGRALARVPGVLRVARRPHHHRRDPHERGVRVHRHADQTPPGTEAGLHRYVLRYGRASRTKRHVFRLQEQPLDGPRHVLVADASRARGPARDADPDL